MKERHAAGHRDRHLQRPLADLQEPHGPAAAATASSAWSLVFLCLALTLQFRLALWVSLGIVISFLGAFWAIPQFGVSLNMISMFAFIVSLGIVVDDAIVVGENIYAWRERGKSPQAAATRGTLEVAQPVILAVLTTVVAFLPLAFVEGIMGKFMFNIPVVVIAILLFSLVESLLILPAHLATMKSIGEQEQDRTTALVRPHQGPHRRRPDGLRRPPLPAQPGLRPRPTGPSWWPWPSATLLITVGFVAGGHLKFTFMPKVDADNLVAALTLPQGTTVEDAERAVEQLEASLEQVRAEFDDSRDRRAHSVIQHVSTSIGSQPRSSQGRPMRRRRQQRRRRPPGGGQRRAAEGRVPRRAQPGHGPPLARAVRPDHRRRLADLHAPTCSGAATPVNVQLLSPEHRRPARRRPANSRPSWPSTPASSTSPTASARARWR